MVPKRLAFDLEVEDGDVVGAEVGHVKLIEVDPTEGAVRGLAQKQVLDVLADKIPSPVRPDPVNTVGSISCNIQVALRVKRQTIRDAGQPFGKDVRGPGTAVGSDFNAGHAVKVAFHDVEVPLGGVKRRAVRKMEGASGKDLRLATREETANHPIGTLPFSGVKEVEISAGIENAEIRALEFAVTH
jgi:hypothetical protein